VSGTQTLHILEALRRSSIRTTQTTSELAASFMANGYFRNCGMPGVMIAIPGPGFVCSLTGVAEAYLDSAAMLLISVVRVYQDNKRFQLQKIDQASMIRPIVKSMVRIDRVSDLQAKLTGAFFSSQAGEPGPVYVEIDDHVLTETSAREASPLPPRAEIDPTIIHNVRERLLACKRVVFFAGQGANQASNFLCKLAEWLRAPVLTTTSARGIAL
jgi:acetolactate synthase-1/2/3 large subunit